MTVAALHSTARLLWEDFDDPALLPDCNFFSGLAMRLKGSGDPELNSAVDSFEKIVF